MESKIFLVTEIEEKGLGCVAQKEIKRGALILREKPCLLIEFALGSGSYAKDYFDDVFKAFEKMNNDQKKTFFELANCYEQIEETKDKMQHFIKYLKENPKPSYLKGDALKIIQITETNRFHNGVCLEMSRFNHSCVSNAEYFWNEDANARDVRAIKYVFDFCIDYKNRYTV
jgi:hypothetical protein